MSDRRLTQSHQLLAENLLLQLGDILGVRLRLHSDVAGDRWVEECKTAFIQEYGKNAVRDMSSRQLPYDLVVLGSRVQCKTRTPKQGRSMSIEKWWGKARYKADAFDFLALKYGDAKYVIPMSALTRRDGTFKNDISPDRFWKYKNQWRIIDSVSAAAIEDSLPLFDEREENATDGADQ